MSYSLEDLKNRTYWNKCSTCKKELPFGAAYYICSVSTCQGKRTGLHFCTVECWDAHLGFARHRDAGALDAVAPTREKYLASLEDAPAPEAKKILVRPAGPSPSPSPPSSSGDAVETLVVVSKVKQLIRDQSEMSTSQCAIDALTQKVVQECRKAIDNAKVAGRKTVMGRDIK
jgi:histone H3/H4